MSGILTEDLHVPGVAFRKELCFLVVYHGISHLLFAFSWYTHPPKGSCITKKVQVTRGLFRSIPLESIVCMYGTGCPYLRSFVTDFNRFLNRQTIYLCHRRPKRNAPFLLTIAILEH